MVADHGGGDVEDNLYEGAVSLCSALECEFSEVRLCKSCNMHFCDEMHALYDGGHRLQTLRNGLRVQDKHGTTLVSQIEDENAAESDHTVPAGPANHNPDKAIMHLLAKRMTAMQQQAQQPKSKK